MNWPVRMEWWLWEFPTPSSALRAAKGYDTFPRSAGAAFGLGLQTRAQAVFTGSVGFQSDALPPR